MRIAQQNQKRFQFDREANGRMSPSKKQTSAYLDFYLWQTPYTRRNHLYWIPNLNCYQAKARPSILLISPNELIRFYRRLISNQILPIIIGSAPGLGNRGNLAQMHCFLPNQTALILLTSS